VFLDQILKKSLDTLPVTLLFDIDNFKSYNDPRSPTGDEIQQTRSSSALPPRARPRARISGDEFAVVFWEKEGPRQSRACRGGATGVARAADDRRDPQRPACDRQLDLEMLRMAGGVEHQRRFGTPFHARTADEFMKPPIRASQGAKKGGKNSIYLIGSPEPGGSPTT
jgi:GGDEF domain-containing protein